MTEFFKDNAPDTPLPIDRPLLLIQVAVRDVLPILLITRILLLAITLTATRWTHLVPDPVRYRSPAPAMHGSVLAQEWFRWDAAWYIRAAGNGPDMGYSRYTENAAHHFGDFAFFPLYPVVVREAAALAPHALDSVPAGQPPRVSLLLTGMVVSNTAFFFSLVTLYALICRRYGFRIAQRAVWILCVFPTSVFFSAAYSESLFALFLVAFFLCLDLKIWWLAGLTGALASATRSLGVALVVPYVATWAAHTVQKVFPPRPLWRKCLQLAPVLLIPLGLVAFTAYLSHWWGNPLLFRDAEKSWGRSFAAPWTGIVDGIGWSLRGLPNGQWSPNGHFLSGFQHLSQPQWRGLVDSAYALVFLTLCGFAWSSWTWSERLFIVAFWIYTLCEPQISDPKYPDTLISMPRFLLVLIPLWIWFARSWWRTMLLVTPSVFLFALYGVRWVNGGWIG